MLNIIMLFYLFFDHCFSYISLLLGSFFHVMGNRITPSNNLQKILSWLLYDLMNTIYIINKLICWIKFKKKRFLWTAYLEKLAQNGGKNNLSDFNSNKIWMLYFSYCLSHKNLCLYSNYLNFIINCLIQV